MKIWFECKTNDTTYPFINYAFFRLANGERVDVDRDETEWWVDNETGNFIMKWRGCYVWDGNKEDYEKVKELKPECYFEGFEIEDDADETYDIKCIDVEIVDYPFGEETIVHVERSGENVN